MENPKLLDMNPDTMLSWRFSLLIKIIISSQRPDSLIRTKKTKSKITSLTFSILSFVIYIENKKNC